MVKIKEWSRNKKDHNFINNKPQNVLFNLCVFVFCWKIALRKRKEKEFSIPFIGPNVITLNEYNSYVSDIILSLLFCLCFIMFHYFFHLSLSLFLCLFHSPQNVCSRNDLNTDLDETDLIFVLQTVKRI